MRVEILTKRQPKDVSILVDHMKSIANAAPRTPFLYYHFPDITGVTIPVYDFLVAAAPAIPTLAGAHSLGSHLQHPHPYIRCKVHILGSG